MDGEIPPTEMLMLFVPTAAPRVHVPTEVAWLPETDGAPTMLPPPALIVTLTGTPAMMLPF
jgi:hypothetical protein